MAVLETLIDPAGVLTGGAVARAELDKVIRKGNEVSDSLGKISQTTTVTGASMRDAFGAAKGGLQVSQGLQQVVSGLEGAISGAQGLTGAANAAGRVLLEISRTAGEWRNLSTAMSTTRTVSQEVARDAFGVAIGMREVVETSRTAQSGLGVLWGVLRANPITAIATALGVAATAMGLFSSRSEEATKGVQRQTSALDGLLGKLREMDVRAGYGQADSRSTPAGTIDALTQLRLSDRRSPFSIGDGAGLFGASEQELRKALGMTGVGERAFELRRAALPGTGQFPGDLNYAMGEVSRSQLISAGEYLLRQRRMLPPGSGPSPFAGEWDYGTGDLLRTRPESGSVFSRERTDGLGVRQSIEQRQAIEEDIMRTQQAMAEMTQQAHEFGQALGGAFVNALSGAQSLRDGLRSIAAEFVGAFARQGMGRAVNAIFDSFGRTAAQSAPPPGIEF